ncbi:hypothetical protein AAC387_Pa09g0247 [Persea americana]
MEGLVGSGFDVANAVRKKRSNTARRPRPDTLIFFYNRDYSPSSSTPTSSDENAGYNGGYRRKEINLNSSASRPSSFNKSGVETFPREFRKDDGYLAKLMDFTGELVLQEEDHRQGMGSHGIHQTSNDAVKVFLPQLVGKAQAQQRMGSNHK